jgi:hypothetical protein
VPEILHTSRDLLILVEQSAESVAPSDGVRLARRRLGERAQRSGLTEGPVWPVGVYPSGAVLDDEERVQPVQGDGVEVKRVASQVRLCLRLEELRPVRAGPPW